MGGGGESLKNTSLLLLWSHCHLPKVLYAVLSKTHSSEVADMVQPWTFSEASRELCPAVCSVCPPHCSAYVETALLGLTVFCNSSWRLPCFSANACSSPVTGSGKVFAHLIFYVNNQFLVVCVCTQSRMSSDIRLKLSEETLKFLEKWLLSWKDLILKFQKQFLFAFMDVGGWNEWTLLGFFFASEGNTCWEFLNQRWPELPRYLREQCVLAVVLSNKNDFF